VIQRVGAAPMIAARGPTWYTGYATRSARIRAWQGDIVSGGNTLKIRNFSRQDRQAREGNYLFI